MRTQTRSVAMMNSGYDTWAETHEQRVDKSKISTKKKVVVTHARACVVKRVFDIRPSPPTHHFIVFHPLPNLDILHSPTTHKKRPRNRTKLNPEKWGQVGGEVGIKV